MPVELVGRGTFATVPVCRFFLCFRSSLILSLSEYKYRMLTVSRLDNKKVFQKFFFVMGEVDLKRSLKAKMQHLKSICS